MVTTQNTPKNTVDAHGLDDRQEDRREHDDGGQRLHEHARKNSSAAMSSRIRMGLVVYSIIWAASCCGIWYMVRNRPKMVDTPTTMRIVPVEMFASFMALNTSFRESFFGDEEADEKGVPHRDDRGFHGRAYACVDAAEDDDRSHERPKPVLERLEQRVPRAALEIFRHGHVPAEEEVHGGEPHRDHDAGHYPGEEHLVMDCCPDTA